MQGLFGRVSPGRNFCSLKHFPPALVRCTIELMTHNLKTTRWQQRFNNFENAFLQLTQAVKTDPLSELGQEGLIKRFEYTFELALKTLKDYLESKGTEAKFPRDVIKEAFHYEIIKDGEIWMDMLEKRNLLAHTYEKKLAQMAADRIIKNYFAAVQQVYTTLKSAI